MSFYKHIKTGKIYYLLAVANDVKNPRKKVIVFQPLLENKIWIREKRSFFSKYQPVSIFDK